MPSERAISANDRAEGTSIRSLGALCTELFPLPGDGMPGMIPDCSCTAGKGLGNTSLPHSLRQSWFFTPPVLRGVFGTSKRSLGDSGVGDGLQGSSYKALPHPLRQ